MAEPVNFVLSERAVGEHAVLLSLEGSTNGLAGDRLRKRIRDHIGRKAQTIIVDLSRVLFIDSAVMRACAEAAQTSKNRGVQLLVVEPVDPMVARPLEMSRLDLIAEVMPTLGRAAKAANLPEESVKSALPPPAPVTQDTASRRRALFGRQFDEKAILQELGGLRRLAQELRRETGFYDKLPPEEIERRRAAEAALLEARAAELREVETESGSHDVKEFEKARSALEATRQKRPAVPDVPPPSADAGADAAAQPASRGAGAGEAAAAAAASAALATAERERDEARAALAQATAEADRMEAEAEEAHVRIQALEGAHAELEQARAEAVASRTALAAAQAEVAAAEDELAAARREAAAARAEADRMEAEAEEAHVRIQALEGDLAAAQQAADAIRHELEGGTRSNEEAAARVQILETDLARAQAEAESLRTDLESAHAAATSTSAGAKAELDQARAEADTARAEADRMEAEAEAAHTRIQMLEADLEEARRRILTLESEAAVPAPVASAATEPEAAPATRPDSPDDRARVSDAEHEPVNAPARVADAEQESENEPARLAAIAPVAVAEPAPPAEVLPPPEPVGPRPRVPVWADPRPINLNTADVDELMLLPGIGRRPAERILQARDANGGFARVDDLYAIKEIPRDRITRIRRFVSV